MREDTDRGSLVFDLRLKAVNTLSIAAIPAPLFIVLGPIVVVVPRVLSVSAKDDLVLAVGVVYE
jgi:hypothetical protein